MVARPRTASASEFAHGKEASADSSRRNSARRISRSAQADALRARGGAARAAWPDRTHRRKERPVTADTALRLGKFFKTGGAFWLKIQVRHDFEMAQDVLVSQIKKIAAYEAA